MDFDLLLRTALKIDLIDIFREITFHSKLFGNCRSNGGRLSRGLYVIFFFFKKKKFTKDIHKIRLHTTSAHQTRNRHPTHLCRKNPNINVQYHVLLVLLQLRPSSGSSTFFKKKKNHHPAASYGSYAQAECFCYFQKLERKGP